VCRGMLACYVSLRLFRPNSRLVQAPEAKVR
jgi:hypothetical protein